MSLEKQWRMIQLLDERTKRGEINWEPGLSDDSVRIKTKAYQLILSQGASGHDPESFDYFVTILNPNGGIVDNLSDSELSNEFAGTGIDIDQAPYRVLDRLYKAARRHALGVDKVLDKILLDLGEIPF